MCVVMDKGPAPSLAKIKLQYLVVTDGKKSAETYVLDVERYWTLQRWCVPVTVSVGASTLTPAQQGRNVQGREQVTCSVGLCAYLGLPLTCYFPDSGFVRRISGVIRTSSSTMVRISTPSDSLS